LISALRLGQFLFTRSSFPRVLQLRKTALMLAREQGKIDIAQLLLDAGAKDAGGGNVSLLEQVVCTAVPHISRLGH
jgi:hypothetical protein